MGKATVKIGTKSRDVAETTLPATRTFRDAWKLNGSVVEVDVAKAKVMALELVESWRGALEAQPFTYQAKQFASDPRSVELIEREWVAAQAAENVAPGRYSLDPGWRAIDGSFLGPLDSDGVRDFFLACNSHLKSAFANSLAKEMEIESATTADDLETIVLAMKATIGDG